MAREDEGRNGITGNGGEGNGVTGMMGKLYDINCIVIA